MNMEGIVCVRDVINFLGNSNQRYFKFKWNTDDTDNADLHGYF